MMNTIMKFRCYKIFTYFALNYLAVCQEKSENFPSSYNVGLYKHVYPPANISIDQLSCVPNASVNKTCPLFIQLIMSFGGAYTSSGVIPGIQVALDQINSRQDILPGYTLHYTLQDSQCNHTTSLRALHAGLFEPPIKIAVMGSGCSVATEPTAEISHLYNLTQISCSSSSAELGNRVRFPKLFLLCVPDSMQAYGFFAIIKNSNWSKVAIIYEDENLFQSAMDILQRLLIAENIKYSVTKYSSDINPFTETPETRIYILSMYEANARETLCRAYNSSKDFRYPRVQFLINGWYNDNWWEGPANEQEKLEHEFGCTTEQRKSLVPYILGVYTVAKDAENYSKISDNGYTGNEVRSAYKQYVKSSLLNVTELYLYLACYEATWVLARALNETIKELSTNRDLQHHVNILDNIADDSDFGLQHFTYKNSKMMDIIYKYLMRTNYSSLLGTIMFSEDGFQKFNILEVLQYRKTGDEIKLQRVGLVYVRQNEKESDILKFTDNISNIWPHGIPYDGVPLNFTVSVHLSVTIIFSILATLGIVFAVICLILNIMYRKTKIIKLTSPYLNILIVTGAIILYINMYIFVIPSFKSQTKVWICNINSWLTAIGYSLCYGTILTKLGRVYYIFHNPSVTKKPLKDWTVAIGVFFLVLIDVSILVTSAVLEHSFGQLSSELKLNRENPEDIIGVMGLTHRYFVYVCNSRIRFIMLGFLYGYKALLQVIALILAASIRKIKIKGLNDAIYIVAAIYVTSIVTVVIIVSTYTLEEFVNVRAVVFSFGLLVGTTVILMLTFFPPLLLLYKDPDGDTVFNGNSDTAATKELEEIAALKDKVESLESQLQKAKKV